MTVRRTFALPPQAVHICFSGHACRPIIPSLNGFVCRPSRTWLRVPPRLVGPKPKVQLPSGAMVGHSPMWQPHKPSCSQTESMSGNPSPQITLSSLIKPRWSPAGLVIPTSLHLPRSRLHKPPDSPWTFRSFSVAATYALSFCGFFRIDGGMDGAASTWPQC